eukprot:scaffold46373_cov21-Tisochrysis_lutea.AAC.1
MPELWEITSALSGRRACSLFPLKSGPHTMDEFGLHGSGLALCTVEHEQMEHKQSGRPVYPSEEVDMLASRIHTVQNTSRATKERDERGACW